MIDEVGLAWEQEEPRRPRRPSSQRRRKKRKGSSFGSKFLWFVMLVALGAGVYWGVGQIQENQKIKEFMASDYDQSDMGDQVDFTVRQGDGGTVIAIRLLNAGIIESRTVFVQICDARKDDCQSIQPGTYTLQMHSPAETVFNLLIDPANKKVSKVTIREGLTVIQTLSKLAEETGKPLAEFQAAAADPAALGITADWYERPGKGSAAAERKSIEGFLFPDTYQYDPAASAQDILKMMVDQFFVVAERVQVKQRAATLGLTPYDVIITASIAQAESHDVDFPKVARVVYNRAYKANMPLGMDSTENYWLELNGKPMKPSGQLLASELNDPTNPYNTHGKKGLPIGPISNPGEAALAGAANPAVGNWVYFVATDANGTTKFAVTWAEFCGYKREAVRNGVPLSLSDCGG
jgi:UPF0755 protein